MSDQVEDAAQPFNASDARFMIRFVIGLAGCVLLVLGIYLLAVNPSAAAGARTARDLDLSLNVVSLQKLAGGIASSICGSIFLAASIVCVRVELSN